MNASCLLTSDLSNLHIHLKERGHAARISPRSDAFKLEVIKSGDWDVLSAEEAVGFLERQVDPPSVDTLAKILYKCRRTKCLSYAKRAYEYVQKNGLGCHEMLGNYLVPMFVDCGSLVDAQNVFDTLAHRNEYAWSSLIHGYVESGEAEHVLRLSEEMHDNGLYPSTYTFLSLLKACIRLKHVDKGWALHVQIIAAGCERNRLVGNTLVDMYAKFGLLAEAQSVLEKIKVRDVVSWTTLISGYAEQGLDEEVLSCLEEMQLEGVAPDEGLYVCSLKSFSNSGSIAKGRDIHCEVIKAGYEGYLRIQNILVDMYAKGGSLVDAWEVFEKMASRGVISWTTLIAGHARHGEYGMVFQLFEDMIEDGVGPNDTTFLILLSVCSHAGLVEKGLMYFNAMENEYGLQPSIKHYNCMLDLLSRAGQLNEAMKMLETLPLSPNVETWKTILSACRKWGNVRIAGKAFEWAVRMNEKHASIFMLMSNIYTDANMWEDLRKVQDLQIHLGSDITLEKVWIEDLDLMHVFVEGHWMHKNNEMLQSGLHKLWDTVKESLNGQASNNEVAPLGHCEELAVTFGLLTFSHARPLRIIKNNWICRRCHEFLALVSEVKKRTIICRDALKFHVFMNGKCSCMSD